MAKNFYKHPALISVLSIIGLGGSFEMYGALSFQNEDKEIIKIIPEKSTGLNDIFVVYNTSTISLKYTSNVNNNNLKWYSFSNLGASFSEPVADIKYSSDGSVLEHVIPDRGYIIEDNDSRYFFWIIDYHNKEFKIQSLLPSSVQSCDATSLIFEGECDTLRYYTINGR